MKKEFFCKVLLITVAIVGLLALSGNLLAQGYSEEAFKRVMEVQKIHNADLMATKGIVGTAVGLNQNDKLVIKVFVTRAEVAAVPKMLDGIPVHVVVTGEFFSLGKPAKPPKDDAEKVDPTVRFERPVPIGVSTGHPDITAGTIGCRVTDGTDVFALSNNHVYANQNDANLYDVVLQPGTYDGGTSPDDVIGTLDDFEDIIFCETEPCPENTIDAAIALTTTDDVGNATPIDGYGIPNNTTSTAIIRQKVQKYGRTTGLTTGRVYAINATVDVNYGAKGIARFVNQIIITPGSFSDGGDSGSLVVKTFDRSPIGLLFAGSNLFTVANPINEVLSSFMVTVDGEQ